MYTEEEMKVLEKVALELFGCKFDALDDDDKDAVYCYAEENVF